MTPLTLLDLEAVLADDRHNGYGYACRGGLSRTLADRLDRKVLQVANEEGLDRELLFHWADSKYGRWLCDDVYSSMTAAELLERVRTYLTRSIAEQMRAGAFR